MTLDGQIFGKIDVFYCGLFVNLVLLTALGNEKRCIKAVDCRNSLGIS